MKNRGFLLFTILISSVFCGKLTPEEDEQRAKICGRVPEDPDDPNPLSTRYAPWLNRMLNFDKRNNPHDSTAFLISPRHMIAKCAPVVDHIKEYYTEKGISQVRNYFNQWQYSRTDHMFNFKNCKNNVMVIPKEEWFPLYSMFSSVDVYNVTSVIYMGNCKPGETPSGILLLEFKVPEDEKKNIPSVPICLSGSKPKEGEEVVEQIYYGMDLTPPSIRDRDSETSQKFVVKNDGCSKQDFAVCVRTCYFESGGFVRKINGASTLLAMNVKPVGYERRAQCGEGDPATSIAFFKEKICEYSGVCKETIVNAGTSSRTSEAFGLMLFILISTFVSVQ